MLKLAERMVMSFFSGVGASTAHAWTTLATTGSDDVRVMTRKSMDDPGRPPGIVLSAATSFWIPVAPKRVFDFLRDENSRSEVKKTKPFLYVLVFLMIVFGSVVGHTFKRRLGSKNGSYSKWSGSWELYLLATSQCKKR